ncbi:MULTISPECIES: N-formylglutamate amidohydrolase [Sinorhizobium]|uniref:N-formylglutamate amidohydrolase n=2 Tax=Sinorhizobium TaxID=28105 RepID=A0A2S3YGA5_9HYPH|nr:MULTISPECIES: N-formylglutamate amidohydrolase [Sinorhizobium]AUX77883.1 N-formylglutamate amidohydrolase protein [Sinorhizobium fredii]PDT40180.1 N-formylglutamate amidohydrolase [Sinorhizobium sp. FG01]PDT51668.1 N-formylglutamate amidohydrolase [Sinorhizobium sp. NG07B]POH25266.1 N-formylglutamate amidohydrolase [Sinorhizobium americanum]POH26628.1 N-formylglutamate amidohydrolase [Sinorhizobium americanum]
MGEVAEWDVFEVLEPASQRIPLVFNSPHSGRYYPQSFLDQSRLDAHSIRRSEDHFVDELFQSATLLGAPLLRAHFPRAFLDVNREPYELDPRMFEGALPPHANISSMRVAGGLGTVPRLVAENMEIYRSRVPVEEALARIESIYKPYHATLRKLIARTHVQFGMAVLIDCHSMPGNVHLAGSGQRPDFIIGDRYGTSAAAELSRFAVELLEQLGYAVTRNKPYAGGFITEHYGRPTRGLHALQIEINRSLYIDEATLVKKPGFAALETDLATFVAGLARHVEDYGAYLPLAAE